MTSFEKGTPFQSIRNQIDTIAGQPVMINGTTTDGSGYIQLDIALEVLPTNIQNQIKAFLQSEGYTEL